MDEELVLCYFRRHWIKILPAILLLPVCLALFVLAIVFYPTLTSQDSLILTLLLFGILGLTQFVHFLFLTIFRYYLSTVILTNMRVVLLDKSVFFKDSSLTVDLTKIQDIQKKQMGLFQHVLKFGALKFDLSGGEPILIYLVPEPDFYFKKMNEIKKALTPGGQGTPDLGSPSATFADIQDQNTTSTVPFLESDPVK